MSMTMAQRPSSLPSTGVPPTESTAPVFEYRCLFTQDLRRKQKRWQDGRLRYHTFNKRVMVLDERGNFVGDTYWREDYEFGEGEELQLERGGYLVEVSECTGQRNQDLSEILDKPREQRVERAIAKGFIAPRTPGAATPRPSATNRPAAQVQSQGQPRSLNALLGMPSGHYGRAVVPTTSPFERRQQQDENRAGSESRFGTPNIERPTKRRKVDDEAPSKSGYAQNLMGATLSLSANWPSSAASSRPNLVRSRHLSNIRQPAKEIDLTGDDDDDATSVGRKSVPVQETPIRAPARKGTSKKPIREPPIRGAAKIDTSKEQAHRSGISRTSEVPDEERGRSAESPVVLDDEPRPKSPKRRKRNPTAKPKERSKKTKRNAAVEVDEDEDAQFQDIEHFGQPTSKPRDAGRKSVPSPRAPSSPPSQDPTGPFRPISPPPPVPDSGLDTSHHDEGADDSDPFASAVPGTSESRQFPPPRREEARPRPRPLPPKRQLLCMDKSTSRPASRTSSDTSTKSKRTAQAAVAAAAENHVEASQATLRLEAFQEAQEQRLQKRMANARRASARDDPFSTDEPIVIDDDPPEPEPEPAMSIDAGKQAPHRAPQRKAPDHRHTPPAPEKSSSPVSWSPSPDREMHIEVPDRLDTSHEPQGPFFPDEPSDDEISVEGQSPARIERQPRKDLIQANWRPDAYEQAQLQPRPENSKTSDAPTSSELPLAAQSRAPKQAPVQKLPEDPPSVEASNPSEPPPGAQERSSRQAEVQPIPEERRPQEAPTSSELPLALQSRAPQQPQVQPPPSKPQTLAAPIPSEPHPAPQSSGLTHEAIDALLNQPQASAHRPGPESGIHPGQKSPPRLVKMNRWAKSRELVNFTLNPEAEAQLATPLARLQERISNARNGLPVDHSRLQNIAVGQASIAIESRRPDAVADEERAVPPPNPAVDKEVAVTQEPTVEPPPVPDPIPANKEPSSDIAEKAIAEKAIAEKAAAEKSPDPPPESAQPAPQPTKLTTQPEKPTTQPPRMPAFKAPRTVPIKELPPRKTTVAGIMGAPPRPRPAPAVFTDADNAGNDGGVEVRREPVVLGQELGPWSKEAFDLFDWRPPGW